MRWFRWDSLAEHAGIHSLHQEDETDEEEIEWRSARKCDVNGSVSADLMRQVHDGDPDGEGVIWPRLAEVSLLGAIGCGGWLMRLIIEELESPDSQYDWVVLQGAMIMRTTGIRTRALTLPVLFLSLLKLCPLSLWMLGARSLRLSLGDVVTPSATHASLRRLQQRRILCRFTKASASSVLARWRDTTSQRRGPRDWTQRSWR